MKLKSLSWKIVMSYRQEAFGLAAIYIVIYHVCMYNGFPLGNMPFVKCIATFLYKGRCGVELFLFLSAVGLYYSLSKNDLKTFYVNRFKKIVPSYLICAVLYFVWYDFFHLKDGVVQFLLNVSTINYWIVGNDYPLWFVSVILVFYLVYPVLYKADEKTKHISSVAIILVSAAVEWYLYYIESPVYENFEMLISRIPVFLLGLLLSKRIKSGREIRLYKMILIMLCGAVCFGASLMTSVLFLRRYLEGIFIICLMMTYVFIRELHILNILGKIFKALGSISLEIYIVHILLFFKFLNSFDCWKWLPTFSWFLIVPAVSIPLAKLASVLADKIVRAEIRA